MSDKTSDNGDAAEVSVELLDEGPCQKRMKVEIPAETIEAEVNSNYDQLRQTVTIPGFRKGRVPRALLEKRFAEQIEDEVREELIQNTFIEQVQKGELQVLGSPKFEEVHFQIGDPLRFDSVFEVAPTFTVPEYMGLEIAALPVEVADSEVDEELENLQKQFGTFEDVALGEQADEDVIGCNVSIKREDEEILQRDDVYVKIGEDKVDNIEVEGLGEKLLPAKEGDVLHFDATMPDDVPNEALKGTEVGIDLTIVSAKRWTLPELNDEFAAKLNMETMDKVREEVRSSLENRRTMEEESRQEEALTDQLLAGLEMDLPPAIVEQRKSELSNALRFRLSREGKSPEEVEKALADPVAMEDDARDELKRIFLLDEIAEKEKVFVTEDEVGARLQAIASTYNRPLGELQEEYRKSGMLEELRNGLRREKVRELVRKKAKVTGSTETETENETG